MSSGLLFHTSTDRAIDHDYYGRRIFGKAVTTLNTTIRKANAKLPTGAARAPELPADTTTHDLRHHFASVLQVSRIASGASFDMIRELVLPATSPFGLDQGRLADASLHPS
ncbi:MAG TPA: hypothetical protein VJT72_08875 [Pseudonocardiaceae bacterium]|nr:hypothetical protein [Pseudonocardiaceae bacterium]